MKAEDLKQNELVDFSEGWMGLHGRRLVLHDIHAFAQFRKDLVDMVGADSARRMFTRFGYFWGQADAAAMKRVFQWDSVEEWIKTGPRLHTLQGVARVIVKLLEVDLQAKRFHMEVVWHDSAEAEEHVVEMGKSETPVCWMLTGYASGYASFCLESEIFFIERQCMASGHRSCAATGKDLASWGPEIKSHRDFFQSENILQKVTQLSMALKKKTAEAAWQSRKIQELEKNAAPPLFVEAHSEGFRKALAVAHRVAAFDTSVLITGETGTGKEAMARYIHGQSARSKHVFVGVNCGALPETLLESELFGHKAGAFTGASDNRTGLFEEAEGGTIFLDEIGDISQGMQLKLLRVLQEREIRRVGESRSRRIDVRVITATNRGMAKALADGEFREDLYYRLRVVEIEIPPLRKRREDIVPMARFLVRKIARKLKLSNLRLDATCVDILLKYAWPGNVRELENAIEHAAVFSKDGLILPEYLPLHVVHANPAAPAGANANMLPLADVEQAHIRRILEAAGNNRAKAARILGISATTLWRRMRQAKMEP